MSDEMKPLLEEDADAFERLLLESEPEEPAPGARDRAIAALGLSNVAASGDDGPPSTRGGPTSGVFTAKWLLPLGLIVASGVAITTVWSPDAPVASVQSEESRPTAARVSEPSPSPAPSPVETVVAAPAITPNALPDAPVMRGAAATPSARHVGDGPRAAAAPLDDALARETLLVDDARRAVAQGEPSRALALLDEHDREFPAGVFLLDADVLRIEALERAGRTAEAERLGQRFLARHPDGSYARRARTALDRMANANGAPTTDAQ